MPGRIPVTLRFWLALAGGALLCLLPVPSLANLAAFGVVVGLPVAAVLRTLRRHDPTADLAEAAGFAVGGLGLAVWTLWTAAVLFGMNRAVLTLAPGLVACLLATLAGRRPARPPAPASEASPSPVPPPARRVAVTLVVVSLVCACLAAAPFYPYGLERPDGVHRMGMTDWHKHLVVTTALSDADEMPPPDPFLPAEPSAPYYYGFQLLGASIHRAAGRSADIFPILLVLTLLIAAALPWAVFVLARGLTRSPISALAAACGATLLGGFDLLVMAIYAVGNVVASWPLPAGLAGLRAAVPSTQLDFWIHHNERSFNPPYVATIWAPQHMLAVLISVLLIHSLRGGERRDERPRHGYLLPALLLAALSAISAYVALALAFAVVVQILTQSWRQRRLPWRVDSFRRWGYAGAGAAILAAPILLGFTQVAASQGLTLHVSDTGSWQNGALFSTFFGESAWARLLDTPLLYMVELGVVGLLGFGGLWSLWRRGNGRAAHAELVVLIVAIVVLVTLVRPPVDGPNNLYARPMLLVWCLLAVYAGELWIRRCMRRWLCWLLVVICAAAVPFAMVGMTLEGLLFWPMPPEIIVLSERITATTIPGELVAVHPDADMSAYGYFLRRGQVATTRRVALLFGAAPRRFDQVEAGLRRAYASSTAEAAAERFGELGARVIVLDRERGPRDAVWATRPCFELLHEGERLRAFSLSPECSPGDQR